jgi:hypothetical protein
MENNATFPLVIKGDDWTIFATLQVNGAAVPISSGASVKAAIVSADHQSALSDVVTQSSATSGANWSTGFVAIVFPSEVTAEISLDGVAWLEIQVVDGGKTRTWFARIGIVNGNI